MTLRRKTWLILGVTLLLGLAFFALLTRVVVERSFLQVEAQQLRVDTLREAEAIEENLAALERDSADWAAWDDTYQFMLDRNARFIESNLAAPSLLGKRIHLLLLVSPEGEIVAGSAFDLLALRETRIPESIRAHLLPGAPLWRDTHDTEPVRGFLLLPEGVLMVVARPIQTSQGAGPSRGTFVLARFLSEEQNLGVDRHVRIGRHDNLEQGSFFLNAASRFDTEGELVVTPQGPNRFCGYRLYRDVYEKPSFILELCESRPVRGLMSSTLLWLMGGLFASSLAMGSVASVLIKTQVLNRLRDFSQAVGEIQKAHDYQGRLNVRGDDELTTFAKGVNHLLETIDADRAVLEKSKFEAEQLAEKAQAASVAKSQFLANMSHEIRTPMNAVVAVADLLERSPLDPEQRRWISTIRTSSDALLSVISDILDFSKIESGRLELECAPFDLRRLLSTVESFTTRLAEKRDLDFSVSIQPDVPAKLMGDSGRIRQILLNLTANAVKFTTRGHVELRCSAQTLEGEQVLLRVEVQDTGIGIAEKDIPRLFRSFSQVDASMARHFGGAGLGLAISRHLVEKMGGEIGVISTIGVGSTFWFTLRLERAFWLESGAAVMPGLRAEGAARAGLRVLVAEDHEVNQEVIKTILDRLGHQVTLVGDGLQAIQACGAEPFDLILMDIQMPRMDGLTAMTKLREQERVSGTRSVIVALTAHAFTEDRERCLQAGADDYLSKPLRLVDLETCLKHHFPVLERSGVESDGAGPSQEAEREASLPRAQFSFTQSGQDLPVFEPERFRQEVGMSEDRTRHVMSIFAQRVPAQIAELDTALKERDLGKVADITHSLKGTAGLLMARRIAFLADQMCRTAMSGRDHGLAQGVEAMTVEYAAFRMELKRLKLLS